MKNIKTLGLAMLTALLVSCNTNNVASTSKNSSSNTPITNSSSTTVVKKQYTITLEENGGSKVNDVTAIEGTSITLPTPVKNNYSFQGWYYDEELTNKFELDVMPSNNVTLYAKWKEITSDDLSDYEKELNSYSEPGHLYIHYKRFTHTEEDYAKWNLWVWAKNKTGREFEWMTIDGNVRYDDFGGAVCDVDLTKTYTDGGNAGNETVSYVDETGALVEDIGFLIVYKSSKLLDGHWQSDGGDQYLNTKDGMRDNGSIHIFAIQDNVYQYKYSYVDEEIKNPYDNDDGKNTSERFNNINSSEASKYAVAATSTTFREDVGVGYQIMTASFADSDGDGIGDIKGITDSLSYLSKTMHVNALWLTPIQLSDSYHGYDIIDYTVVDPKFGSTTTNYPELLDEKGRPTSESAMADYKELVSEAHKLGIKIIMDLVINHTSVNNVWFKKSAALEEEYRGFYQWKNHDTDKSVANNVNWHKYSTYSYSYYGKFASSMPELNYDYQGTRDAIVDVAKFWLGLLGDGTGVDGFRIDAVKHIYMADEVTQSSGDVIILDGDYSSNLTKNLHFFREFNARIKEVYPNAAIIGENFDGHAYRVAPYYEGLDSMLNFYMYYNLSQAVAAPDNWSLGSKLSGVGNVDSFNKNDTSVSNKGLTYGGTWNFPGQYKANDSYRQGDAIESYFTSNHDVARVMNNVIGSVNGIDLRAGTISSSNAATAIKKAKVYGAAVLTLPGISWVYYGDELGMSGNYGTGENANSAHADRWYRQPFKWGNDASAPYTTGFTFSGDKTYGIGWDSYNETLKGVSYQKMDKNSILNVYSAVSRLKSTDEVLIYGDYTPLSAGGDVFAFKRTLNGKTYYIYHNFGSRTVNIAGNSGEVLYSLNNATKTSLPGYSSLIVG